MDGDGRAPGIIAVHRLAGDSKGAIGDKEVTFHIGGNPKQPFPSNLPTSPDKTLSYRDIVEQARLYILTDCQGSFERFAMWGLIRAKE